MRDLFKLWISDIDAMRERCHLPRLLDSEYVYHVGVIWTGWFNVGQARHG